MRLNSATLAAALLAISLPACAGPPPPGQQASAGKHVKCERATGSMFCGTGDDMPYASGNSPGDSAPRSNATQSALSSGLK